jgi:hypothetical protein
MSTVTFIDPSGTPIANGLLRIHLNADAKGGSQVSAKVFNLALDVNGTADTSTIKLPSTLTNNFGTNQVPSYIVEVFSATGEQVFGPTEPNDPVLPSPLQ